jgi:hypothetical protein
MSKKQPAGAPLPDGTFPADQFKNQKHDRIPDNSGVGQTPLKRKHSKLIEAANNHILSHNGGQIVFGGDRPSNLTSGGGGAGFYKNSTIDIVVGRASKNIDLNKVRKNDDPIDGFEYVGNLFTRDAARIYISESTELDKNFGLAFGPRQPSGGKNTHPVSGVAVKADTVRVIGTEGVNIVTGPANNFSGKKEGNSLKGKVSSGGTINLIAGNYADEKIHLTSPRTPGTSVIKMIPYLQPAVKGDFLVECLHEVVNYVDTIEAAVFNLCLILCQKDASLAPALLNPPAAAALLGSAAQTSIWGTSHAYTGRIVGNSLRNKYLTYGKAKHIRSPNVYLT